MGNQTEVKPIHLIRNDPKNGQSTVATLSYNDFFITELRLDSFMVLPTNKFVVVNSPDHHSAVQCINELCKLGVERGANIRSIEHCDVKPLTFELAYNFVERWNNGGLVLLQQDPLKDNTCNSHCNDRTYFLTLLNSSSRCLSCLNEQAKRSLAALHGIASLFDHSILTHLNRYGAFTLSDCYAVCTQKNGDYFFEPTGRKNGCPDDIRTKRTSFIL